MADPRLGARLGARVGVVTAAVALLLGAVAAPAGAAAQRVVRFEDPRITEASALVLNGDDLVTTNDSGDVGRVFTVDARTGRTVGVTDWSPYAVDTEALAPAGDGQVWVGDIGDNNAVRPFVTITRVPVGPGQRTVHATSYRLVYPHGPVDAESLLADPTTGRLYIATKEILGGTLYAVPRRLDPDHLNRLRAVGPVVTTATDGAFFPDGRHIIIRGYFDATVYDWPSLQPVDSFPMPRERQGEGIAVRADDSLVLDSEGPRSWVLTDRLPAALRRAVAPLPPPTPTSSPGAAGSRAGSAVGADGHRGDGLLLVGVVAAAAAGLVALIGLLGVAGRALRRRQT